jgi:hypothetical protein
LAAVVVAVLAAQPRLELLRSAAAAAAERHARSAGFSHLICQARRAIRSALAALRALLADLPQAVAAILHSAAAQKSSRLMAAALGQMALQPLRLVAAAAQVFLALVEMDQQLLARQARTAELLASLAEVQALRPILAALAVGRAIAAAGEPETAARLFLVVAAGAGVVALRASEAQTLVAQAANLAWPNWTLQPQARGQARRRHLVLQEAALFLDLQELAAAAVAPLATHL